MKCSHSKKFPELASVKDCTNCLACESACKFGAISHEWDDEGHYRIVIEKEKCVGCMQCQKVCEKSRCNYGNNDLRLSTVYAGWTSSAEDRKRGTSGGVFAALARRILEEGGCVVGAVLDENECKQILIEDVEHLGLLQGSKYMSSSMAGIYHSIEQKLKTGDVLFSGVGCQCAGVLAYFDKKTYQHRLYTVDLVCGGGPSKILVDKYLEYNPQIEKIISFRTKDRYELVVKDTEKTYVDAQKNLPLHGFNCGMTSRYSCYHCQFAKAHRKTDITIGDLWNYAVLPEEHAKGLSMIIVHSQDGMKLLQKSGIALQEIKWDQVLFKNKRIVCGKQRVFLPRRLLAKNSHNMSYENFRKLYCMDISVRNPVMMAFRIYRFAVQKMETYFAKRYIKNLLKK